MTAGRNKGKKYRKLQGFEQATEETEARAAAFMAWYGDNFTRIRDKLIFVHLYDDQVATDTALNVYESIALKGLIVQDYQFYFLRAYHTNRLAMLKRKTYEVPLEFSFQSPDEEYTDFTALLGVADTPDFDYELHEDIVQTLSAEMLEYVRAKYDPLSASLFEIYIGLLPDTSYKRLSELLGIPVTRIWTSIGAIRKDLALQFENRKVYLLSLI